MEKTNSYHKWMNGLAILLVLPAAWFFVISILKYQLGIDGPFDAAEPFLEKLGIDESLGWNINLLILFGPVGAFILAIVQVLRIDWNFTREEFSFRMAIYKKWIPLVLAMTSVVLLGILFFYLLGENCHCI